MNHPFYLHAQRIDGVDYELGVYFPLTLTFNHDTMKTC